MKLILLVAAVILFVLSALKVGDFTDWGLAAVACALLPVPERTA